MPNLCTRKRLEKFTNVKRWYCVKRGVNCFGKTNVRIKKDGNHCWCLQCKKLGRKSHPKLKFLW